MNLVYVDDKIFLSADVAQVPAFKTQYVMQGLGDLKHHLGITIKRNKGQIKLHQTAYAKEGEARCNHLLSERKRQCKVVTPLPPGMTLTKDSKEYAEAFPYQFVVGALTYLAVHT